MKVKYFLYLLIISYITKIAIAIFEDFIVEIFIIDLKIEPITLGLYTGIPRLLILISVIGLIFKIYRYHNKEDFLNS